MQKALFVTMQASPGYGDTVAEWLRAAVEPIENEPQTRDWYALRFAPDTFAIFDTFDGNRGRLTHLLGKVGRGLIVRTFTLLKGLPDIRMADILAAESPEPGAPIKAAVHSTVTARDGQERDVTAMLLEHGAQTTGPEAARYAMRTGGGNFLILDFLSEAATIPPPSPLSGQLASLTRKVTDPWRAEVLAYKLA
jgi:hypothetical protein